MTSSTHHLPSIPWTFDESVTDCFDDMLQRSIPDYFGMRQRVTELALCFVQPSAFVMDLGCSRGEMIAQLKKKAPFPVSYIGVDASLPMVEASRKRFEQDKDVTILHHDLKKEWPRIYRPRVVLSVLTLQFLPVIYRLSLIQKIYDFLLPGGCFILVEKVKGHHPLTDSLLIDLYHRMKHQNGYPWESIQAKKKALEGVLIPLTVKENEAMIREAGFTQVEGFWRHLNFAGFLAVKPRKNTKHQEV